jgi:uncharacterized protein
MPESQVICNTSPLYYLHLVGKLDLLPSLYSRVRIPPAVRDELRAGQRKGVSAPEVEKLPWIEVQESVDRTLLPIVIDLGHGEAEAIALALETPGSLLILDDSLGRRIAQLAGLTCTGTLGVLIKAKKSGLLTEIRSTLAALEKTSMYLGKGLIAMALREAEED